MGTAATKIKILLPVLRPALFAGPIQVTNEVMLRVIYDNITLGCRDYYLKLLFLLTLS